MNSTTLTPTPEILAEYFELLRFPSISAEPARLKDCVDCAMWLKKWLAPLGFKSELVASPKHLGAPPVLFAERPGSPTAPTLLFYGHYDVQPPDPLAEWSSPPFEPVLKPDNRVYARGAQDDKGQLFSFLCGMRSLIASRSAANLPLPTLKILLEGQEETGSSALTALAPELAPKINAHAMLVCDTSAAEDLRPAIVAGLRGVSHFTVRLSAASRDLHSGEFGGIAPNPAQGIAELVASLHRPDGSIAVPGFCDSVLPPSPRERDLAESAAMSPEAYERELGCPPLGGEAGLTITDRNSFQPTIEVNGIHSGYGGPGSKTVIPASAFAKISMRLVPGQSPADAMDCVLAHLKLHTPRGMSLSVEDVTGEAPGFRLPVDSPVFRLASSVLESLDPRGPVFQWDGASIPVVSTLREASGAAPLLVGWGQPADCIHSPNESYSLSQFAKSMQWASQIISAFADI